VRRAVLLLACVGLSASALAATATRLDDSLSPRQRIQATTTWVYPGTGDLSSDQLNALVAVVPSMEFRLRTSPYVGHDAEIYLSIPRGVSGLRSPTAMRLEWTTHGLFAAGSLTPGSRALVYRGRITDALMTGYFDFRVFLDARTSEFGIEFDPTFEIELLP
jgi:hypothetical protein